MLWNCVYPVYPPRIDFTLIPLAVMIMESMIMESITALMISPIVLDQVDTNND